jgi:hypothetical protein
MSWRNAALPLIVAGLLSGCVTAGTGLDYAGVMQKAGPPRAGQARIVVLQEKATGLGTASCLCDMKLDGAALGRLKPGTYVYADRPAGRHHLSATETMFPGETTRDVTTQSGRTYFLLARTSDRHDKVVGMTYVAGLAGALVTAAATSGADNAGPADFVPLDEATGRATIAELQLAE